MKLFKLGKKKNKGGSCEENINEKKNDTIIKGVPTDLQEIFKQNMKYISRFQADVDTIKRQFVKSETRFFLTIGTVDIPSGRITVADPLCYLPTGKASPVLARTVPAGSYPVEVALCRSEITGIRMCTARLKIKDTAASRYELAESTPETAIMKCSDGDMSGFPVDAGMMSFIDAEEAENYRRFIANWHKENPDGNHYDDYFAYVLAESDRKLPQFQREGGDFAEWTNPDSGRRMVMIASGFGDGLYQAFWGIDSENEICELIVPMVNPDIFD